MSDECFSLEQGEGITRPGHLQRLWRNAAVQDFFVLGFHAYVCLRALYAADGPAATSARIAAASLLGISSSVLLLTRGELLPPGFGRSLVYRLGLFVPMVASYFTLRFCLIALHPQSLDAELYHIDRWLFGQTPAVLLDRFVTPASVEWFAFFYYGYFALVGLYTLGTLIFDTGVRAYELLLATALVVGLGHIGYTLVPGVGPYSFCAGMFTHPLRGGAWWFRVEQAVRSGGAVYDIFPSLHTALPMLFVLHSFRHRAGVPYQQIWLPVSAVVVNIILATVFLRWHYGIDLIAGVLLAVFAQRVAVFAWRFEGARDGGYGVQPVWERLAPAGMKTEDFNFASAIFLIHFAAILLCAATAL